ncbi:hypothetical protein G7Y89_g8660 [Cudoniella acicularis]|uniref:Uncharacterized protein n=1 Tax=Cudoniella acicularis TaxID=354080 RepID=A0A8H4RIZ2_9HELO|nr:hypothetical protein G7Y89_g8660 [Cudoniella acicularis]
MNNNSNFTSEECLELSEPKEDDFTTLHQNGDNLALVNPELFAQQEELRKKAEDVKAAKLAKFENRVPQPMQALLLSQQEPSSIIGLYPRVVEINLAKELGKFRIISATFLPEELQGYTNESIKLNQYTALRKRLTKPESIVSQSSFYVNFDVDTIWLRKDGLTFFKYINRLACLTGSKVIEGFSDIAKDHTVLNEGVVHLAFSAVSLERYISTQYNKEIHFPNLATATIIYTSLPKLSLKHLSRKEKGSSRKETIAELKQRLEKMRQNWVSRHEQKFSELLQLGIKTFENLLPQNVWLKFSVRGDSGKIALMDLAQFQAHQKTVEEQLAVDIRNSEVKKQEEEDAALAAQLAHDLERPRKRARFA